MVISMLISFREENSSPRVGSAINFLSIVAMGISRKALILATPWTRGMGWVLRQVTTITTGMSIYTLQITDRTYYSRIKATVNLKTSRMLPGLLMKAGVPGPRSSIWTVTVISICSWSTTSTGVYQLNRTVLVPQRDGRSQIIVGQLPTTRPHAIVCIAIMATVPSPMCLTKRASM